MTRSLLKWNSPLDSFFSDYPTLKEQSARTRAGVNLKRDDKYLSVELYIPGYKKDEVNITFKNNQLTVEGEKTERKEEHDNYDYQEVYTQNFRRVISLDESVDTDKAEAKLEDGVLNIQIPNSKQATEQTLSIK